MSKEQLVCGFCGKECNPSDDVGFIVFPDGKSKSVHLSHIGVKDEWQRQHPEKKK